MWKWIIGIAAVPLGAAAIVVAAGAMLPRDHVAMQERFVPIDPASVAAMVRDVERYASGAAGLSGSSLRGGERKACASSSMAMTIR